SQKQNAGELARYLLDLIPRETAEQFQLPVSQDAPAGPPSAPSCLKPASRPNASGDLNQKPQPRAPLNQNQAPTGGQPPVGDPPGASATPNKPSDPGLPNKKLEGAQGASSPVEPMTANLRPTILYREKAKYTEVARINSLQGTVALNVVFGEEGKISNIRVIRCLPDGLTQGAIAAAQVIRFNPAIKNGTPVSVRGALEFTFNLY